MNRFTAAILSLMCALGLLSAHAAYTTITEAESLGLGGGTGGDEIRLIDNGDKTYDIIHLFTQTGASANPFIIPTENEIIDRSVRILVVAGGGAGGGDCGGGGGAGEYLSLANLVPIVGTHNVTVGAGGAGIPSGTDRVGTTGGNTTFVYGSTTYLTRGGGGGGTWGSRSGVAGGSGGGSSGYSGAGSDSNRGGTIAVSPGIGNVGGYNQTSPTTRPSGGGGGAGGPGGIGNDSGSGVGGDGLQNDISGELRFYAAGGGGGGANSTTIGAKGGSGIGGEGSGSGAKGPATAGAENTGSGGGGGAGGSNKAASGAGGSGVVIVRYTVSNSPIKVLGGTWRKVDDDDVYFFDASQVGTMELKQGIEAHILVVGGGGAGASPAATTYQRGGAGGGGAGGLIENKAQFFMPGTYTITVGKGGAKGEDTTASEGANGDPSTIIGGSLNISAAGGGGGGLGYDSSHGIGHDGGSGGGGSAYSASAQKAGGSPVAGQGNAGGKGTITRAGAGGGGAGGPGADSKREGSNDVGGDGGEGLESDITGELKPYAAGGGGGTMANYSTYIGIGGSGGSEIGGNGGGGSRADGQTAATDGDAGTGSGGGGGSYNKAGGAGGSGVIIIRIKKIMPVKPAPAVLSWPYDGHEHGPVEINEGDPIVVVAGTNNETEVGDYSVTVAPAEGYKWSDGTTNQLTFEWHITKPTLVAESLTIRGWQELTDVNNPELVVKTAQGVIVELPEENVKYKVREKGVGGEWKGFVTLSDWPAFAATLTAAEYELTADITGTASYDPPATIPVATLNIWAARDARVQGLAYSCDLTINGYRGPTKSSAPLLVEVAEDIPQGFSYRHAQLDGSDIRFTSKDGTILEMSKMMWNPNGCSVFVVQVPQFSYGQTITMNWGRTVDEDGEDVPIPDAPVLPQTQPLYHFDFNGTKTNSGTHALTMNEDSDARGVWEKTGFVTDYAVEDQAISKWTGYTGSFEVPSGEYSVAIYAKTSPTVEQTGRWRLVWSLGNNGGGGYALLSEPGGSTIRLISWPNGSTPYTTVIEATVNRPSETYHQYRINIASDHAGVELIIDGISRGTGTLSGNSIKNGNVPMQVNGIHGGKIAGTDRSLDDWISDLTIYQPPSTSFEVGPVFTAKNSRLKNYWLRVPNIGADEWGTGEEPTPDFGLAAYGDAYFKIAPIGGEPLEKNVFPGVAGEYSVEFHVDAGKTAITTWQALATEPKNVVVTAHSPYSDLSGTSGSPTRAGRVLLANNYDRDDQLIEDQAYDHTEGDIYWTHDDAQPSDLFPNLRVGTKHTLASTNTVEALCDMTSLWTIDNAFIGTTKDNTVTPTRGRMPIYLPRSGSDDDHIVMRNIIGAKIQSACFADGVGTLYFDAVNSFQDASGANYGIKVEVVEGIYTDPVELEDAPWHAVEMRPLFFDSETSTAFNELDPTTEFSLNATTTSDTGYSLYRIIVPLNIRGPVTLRIVRTTAPGSEAFALDEGGFILVDNVVVSYPPTRIDIEPFGQVDLEKHDKTLVGVEGSATIPYPGLGDEIYLKAKAVTSMNPGAPKEPSLSTVKGHYRWRYLEQAFDPEDESEWKSVDFNAATLTAAEPLEIPHNRVGDVEFYFTATSDAPYYKYYDYTALNLALGRLYTEEVYSVEDHREGGKIAATHGNDWYIRVREGASAYGSVNLIVETVADTNAYATVPLVLEKDHLWRGYLKTTDPIKEGLKFRLTATEVDLAASEFTLITNAWKSSRAIDELPASASFEAGTTNDWSFLICDATTGHIMFQLDDLTHSLTVAHADYQDFNRWNDAHIGAHFVGSSELDEKKSGVSAKMRDYLENFSNWTDTPSVKQYWRESFTVTGSFPAQFPTFVPFSTRPTPNGWIANNGMFVTQKYMTDSSTGAFQMQGQGKGSIEYPSKSGEDPRGLESVSYCARLAQTIDFDDIAWRYANDIDTLSKYTFAAQVAMSDTITKNKSGEADKWDFDGAGQVSMVACYRPQKGCYEFRVTRSDDGKILRELYKWTSANGVMKAQRLTTDTQNASADMFRAWRADTSKKPCYPLMYISVNRQEDGSLQVQAGYSTGHSQDGTVLNESGQAVGFRSLTYWDANPGDLKAGTYGIASANAKSAFLSPRLWSTPVNWVGGNSRGNPEKSSAAINFPTEPPAGEDDAIKAGKWVMKDGRTVALDDTDVLGTRRWGLKGAAVPQPVVVEYKLPNTADWVPIVTNMVDGFTLSNPIKTYVYTKRDATYRIAHAGTMDDVRTDVTIDNIEFAQLRGDKYGSIDTTDFASDNDGYGFRTNIVFTSGWIIGHKVKLSAKRTMATEPSSIRSPLCDGNGDRGLGLGMVTFTYENAQANAKILVQIATNNVQTSAVRETDSIDPAIWTTITNYDFSAVSPEERASGTRNCYFGLHGVKGLMRIVVDPERVRAVEDITNPNEFGEIDITSILFRDEPALDLSSWWGWNIRTLNDDHSSRYDDGTRTYLPDADADSPAGSGLSIALNNSIVQDVDPNESASYAEHMPFIQTPTFVSNIVGEVTFKARKFGLSEIDQNAELRLYGAQTGDPTAEAAGLEWQELAHFIVTNSYYETYHYRSSGPTYRAFRLAVTGVDGVKPEAKGPSPSEGAAPVRVLVEELAVTEAVYPTVGFRYVYPVRTELTSHEPSPAVIDTLTGYTPNCDEQPLLNEEWTLQAEIEAKQLPDELDLDTPGHEPRVIVSWFKGRLPWGYEKWANNVEAKTAELKAVEGDKMTFRGSFKEAPAAVVPASEIEGSVVQYMASVIYYDKVGDVHTNVLSRSDWVKPYWYDPVNYNQGQPNFAGFTILESISPRRAWINEVNVWDGRDANWEYPGRKNQYVEIAVPADQPLEGWELQYIDNSLSVTNTLCRFGTEADCDMPGKKKDDLGPVTNEYSFVVVQSPATRDAKTWDDTYAKDGHKIVIDGTWRDFDENGGNLGDQQPIALRLVRPSQVVEHEIVFQGTNQWAGTRYYDQYSPERYVEKLREFDPIGHSNWFVAGDEMDNDPSEIKLDGRSLSVTNVAGHVVGDWTNKMHQTPGWCNEGEIIPEGYVIYANGEMIVITASVKGGHIYQTFGEKTLSDEVIKVTALKGGEGTNITYTVDSWYELKSLTTNDVALAEWAGKTKTFTVNIGAGCSNNIQLVATSQPWSKLADYGYDPNDRFADAIMDWLEGNKTLRGAFANPGEIHPAEYHNLRGEKICDLNLKELYWLDMDPTEAGWVFEAGVSEVKPVAKPAAKAKYKLGVKTLEPPEDNPDYPPVTSNNQNLQLTVKMTIKKVDEAGVVTESYAPYVLRSAEKGKTSIDYDHGLMGDNWNSASFMVTGDLQNGLDTRERWVPLRWFYFLPDSFDEKNEAVIEIWDPFDPNVGPSGWDKWLGTPVFYSWAIKERTVPTTTEPLKPDSTF